MKDVFVSFIPTGIRSCTILLGLFGQDRSQPHSPGWARVPLSSFSLKFWSIILIFPQTLLIFFLILALRVGDSPTREGPGDTTVFGLLCVVVGNQKKAAIDCLDWRQKSQTLTTLTKRDCFYLFGWRGLEDISWWPCAACLCQPWDLGDHVFT